MPAKGLPSALEGALNALIKENPLSAFNIDGRGDNVVVTLRFSTGRPNATASVTSGEGQETSWHQTRSSQRRFVPSAIVSTRSTRSINTGTPRNEPHDVTLPRLKPVLNWANVCSPNILRTLRRTMIRFLIELLVRRIWLGQSRLYFILNFGIRSTPVLPQ